MATTPRPRKKCPILPIKQIAIETGAELAERLQLHNWDYIIAGDGSATTWDAALGFGSILYRKHDSYRKRFFGGFSNGTNNTAEMMAVILPLFYIEAMANSNPKSRLPNVYIISDSAYVVNGGNGQAVKKAKQMLWASIDHMKTKMNLIFVHVHRKVLSANVFGDRIGNAIRLDFEKIKAKLTRRFITKKKTCTQNTQK